LTARPVSFSSGNTVEYFTCFNAKLDLIPATPSIRVSESFRNRSYAATSGTTTRSR
jgi:hypothetical protein